MNNFYGYIVDKYSRFQKNENVLKIFVIDICGAPLLIVLDEFPQNGIGELYALQDGKSKSLTKIILIKKFIKPTMKQNPLLIN